MRPIISIHIPKASGSSISAAFAEAVGDGFSTLYTVDPVDPCSPEYIDPVRYQASKLDSIAPAKVVHGHFSPRHFERVKEAHRFAILREPVDNLISIYFYWRSTYKAGIRAHCLYEYAMKNELSLTEFAQLPLLQRLYSSTYFGGVDMETFDMVGRYDERSAYINELSKVSGLLLKADIHENKTETSVERENTLADSRLIARIRGLLSDDIKFYEKYAC